MTYQQPEIDGFFSSVEDDRQCEVNENDLALLRNNEWLNDKVHTVYISADYAHP